MFSSGLARFASSGYDARMKRSPAFTATRVVNSPCEYPKLLFPSMTVAMMGAPSSARISARGNDLARCRGFLAGSLAPLQLLGSWFTRHARRRRGGRGAGLEALEPALPGGVALARASWLFFLSPRRTVV